MPATIFLHRGHVGSVAREDLVTERHPFARDHQGDVHLHAIGPVVAAVAALGDGWIGHPLEIGAGHVVEQQVVVDLEQLAEALAPGALRWPPCAAAADPAPDTAARRRCARTPRPSRSSSAVVRYHCSATCSSLDGSHSRPITRMAITSAHATASRPRGSSPPSSSSNLSARHSVQPSHAAPKLLERSRRTALSRTLTALPARGFQTGGLVNAPLCAR